jgi:hypothetical protein
MENSSLVHEQQPSRNPLDSTKTRTVTKKKTRTKGKIRSQSRVSGNESTPDLAHSQRLRQEIRSRIEKEKETFRRQEQLLQKGILASFLEECVSRKCR